MPTPTSTTFNTTAGQTIAREMLIAYLNTGTAQSPVWSPIGKRVTDSSAEYDWSGESAKDILGNTNTSMKKPIVTQTFDPVPLDAGDAAAVKIWEMAVRDQDADALCAQDMLIVHLYSGTASTAMFAERYSACAINVNSLGGSGGSQIDMPFNVTYGGTRAKGSAAISSGTVTFTADS